MNLADFFKQPTATYCDVQGVPTDVLVEVDYHPPRRDPVCCKCLRACNVIAVQEPDYDNGITAFYKTEGRSFCCKAGYTLADESAVFEQAEVLEVRNTRGVSVMDSMYMGEITELEDRLLAMAKADLVLRKRDAVAFAVQVREETIAATQAQRGVR